MRKKLLLSLLSAIFIILYSAQPALASGSDYSPSQTLYEISDSKFYTNNSESVSKTSESTSIYKLERIDIPLMENAYSDDLSEASSSNVLYSPDLPDSLCEEELSCGPNYYLALELEMINMVNEARREAGVDELEYSDELSYFARLHSYDMAENHYFSHTSPTNGSYVTRLYASGINYISSGENLARFSDIEDAQEALLESFGHKLNMLSDKYTHVGIGIVWDDDLEVYCITQWFARFY